MVKSTAIVKLPKDLEILVIVIKLPTSFSGCLDTINVSFLLMY